MPHNATRALGQLQQGMQALAQRFMEMMANGPGRGQRRRPQGELEYIDRLLEQF